MTARGCINSLSSGNLEGSVSTMYCYPLRAKGTNQSRGGGQVGVWCSPGLLVNSHLHYNQL